MSVTRGGIPNASAAASNSSDRFADQARALFYTRMVFLAITLAVLAIPSWSQFLGTTSPVGIWVYFLVLTYTVGNFLVLDNSRLAYHITYITLVFDLLALACLVLTSGGLHSPVMAAYLISTLFFGLLFPHIHRLVPLFFFLPVVTWLDPTIHNETLVSTPWPDPMFPESLFLVVWYMCLSLMIAYIILYLNSRAEYRHQQLLELSKAQEQNIVTEERLRLAREIHDGLGGTLSCMIMQLEYIQRQSENESRLHSEISELKEQSEEAMEELRRSLTVMRRDFDLHKTLEDYCAKIFDRTLGQTACSFKVKGRPRRIPSAMQLTVFRLLQECLNNIIKHAKASKVKVRLSYDNDMVLLKVADDGIGFDNSSEKVGHYGLVNMQERAKKFRGTLEVQSAPGEGTAIHATLVIPAAGSHVMDSNQVAVALNP